MLGMTILGQMYLDRLYREQNVEFDIYVRPEIEQLKEYIKK